MCLRCHERLARQEGKKISNRYQSLEVGLVGCIESGVMMRPRWRQVKSHFTLLSLMHIKALGCQAGSVFGTQSVPKTPCPVTYVLAVLQLALYHFMEYY